ncbi:MAG: 30S ribosomal protein S16 [Candidatus Gastranaerophilaceae bacterium]|jgi:small subunit ribosomal protein S16
MVKIRLKRMGYKRNPIYRVVVINSRDKREGRPIQEIGFYNPKTKEMKLDKETALDWIKKGAQPSDTAEYLIKNCKEDGTLDFKKAEEKKLSKKAQAKLEAEKAKTEKVKVEEVKTEEVKEETPA